MKMIIVAGARPNFMKIAPLIRAIKKHNLNIEMRESKIDYVLVHTGQHYDIEMSEGFFRDLELPPPDINLEVGSASHAEQTANLLTSFEKVCLKEKPKWVIVVGDVNSTMACSLVSAKMGIKIAHVEAGLRSYDRDMPEEINRLVTDVLADLLFTPSADADENLIREGISLNKIKRVGNVMIDTLILNMDKTRQAKAVEKYDLKAKHFVYVTLHRPSNVDDETTLTAIIRFLITISEKLQVVFAVHPRTQQRMESYGLWADAENTPNLILTKPLSYHDSMSLIEKSRFVLTDSGGIQEETTYLKIPCLTLRPNTERPITITQGTNRLTTVETLEKDCLSYLNGNHPDGRVPELWDGLTGERIIRILVEQG